MTGIFANLRVVAVALLPPPPPPLDSTRGQAGLTDPHFAISFLQLLFVPRKLYGLKDRREIEASDVRASHAYVLLSRE